MNDISGNDPLNNDEVDTGRRFPRWILVVVLLFSALLFTIGAFWIYRTARAFSSTWELTPPQFEVGAASETPAPGASPNALANPIVIQEQTTPVASPARENPLEPWSGQERVNFLLLGIDQRCGESGPTHTDTMMVASIDPTTLSAVALSLPRDLWTEIPNFGVNRVNQAHYLGEANNYPGGGPALAVETVEALLGIPIHYYGAANFDAFTEFVDLIGGIDIEVPEAIDDPKYPDSCYGYEPFRIAAGTHHLDGTQALRYARTRATLGGDIDRAGRQQQVIMAVRNTILDLDMVPRLLTQGPLLWQSFQENIRTNMSLEEAMQLALLAKDIPQENIRLAVIDYNYLYPETTPGGQQVLAPDRDRLRELRDSLFGLAAIPTPSIPILPERIAQENARVAILNGTPIFGLAATTQNFLESFNVNVTEIGNADAATYPSTIIYDYSTSHATADILAQLLDIPPLNVIYATNPAGAYDILIILGNDSPLVTPTPAPTP